MAESEEAESATDRRTEDRPSEQIRSQTFHGVALVNGATLLLTSSRPLDIADLEAIRAAAGPLIETLMRRELIHLREEGETR